MSERAAYAVWELTLACNLGCQHCGSRAGTARPDELSTEEALNLVGQMADAGITEVTLIGGEAYLRKDWPRIVRALVARGIHCGITTGAYKLSAKMAQEMAAAGVSQVSISVDGLQATHDGLRGRQGSWDCCFQAFDYLKSAGIAITCNTQINRLSVVELPQLYALLREVGIEAWQMQLTVPMGNAADHPEILLQPYELLELFPLLVRLKSAADRDGIQFRPGNNIGYFGPLAQVLFAENGIWDVWNGCPAGLGGMGIEADGTIKGCPSLPTTAYAAGNIRTRTLADLALNTEQMTFNLAGSTDHLWGFCGTCEHKALCRGGCTWTAHTFFDRKGNNPYCHHRAVTLAQQGKRERFFLSRSAQGVPFDNGEFTLVEELCSAELPSEDKFRVDWSAISWPSEFHPRP